MATLIPCDFTQIPHDLIQRILFMTRQEAQRLLDRYYPGWYIKVDRDGIARLYSPQRIMMCTIRGKNNDICC